MLFGLDDETIALINKTFDDSLVINEVVIYGSRAKGNYREGSDIDLTITKGTATFTDLLQLKNEIDDLPIAYKVDISIFKTIGNSELKEHIINHGKVFYTR